MFVLQRIDGNAYPYTFQARDQGREFTADFETTWDLLMSKMPDRAIHPVNSLNPLFDFPFVLLSDITHMKLDVLGMIDCV